MNNLLLRRRKMMLMNLDTSQYTPIEYIGATGTQYIQTNITTANGMTIVSKFYGAAPSQYSSSESDGSNITTFWKAGNQGNWLKNVGTSLRPRLYGNNGSLQAYFHSDSFYDSQYFKLKVAIDGGTTTSESRLGRIHNENKTVFNSNNFLPIGTSSSEDIVQYGNIYIFKDPSYEILSTARFYGMDITENGIVTHNLIPALRVSDSEIGVLDTITNTFYLNSGSGVFLYPE